MTSPKDDPNRERQGKYAWEGGGKHPRDGPSKEGRDLDPERHDSTADRDPNVNDADFYHQRLTPGGQTPAHTPGGTGPTTRDAHHAVTDDANKDAVKRVELGGDLRKPFEQGDA